MSIVGVKIWAGQKRQAGSDVQWTLSTRKDLPHGIPFMVNFLLLIVDYIWLMSFQAAHSMSFPFFHQPVVQGDAA